MTDRRGSHGQSRGRIIVRQFDDDGKIMFAEAHEKVVQLAAKVFAHLGDGLRTILGMGNEILDGVLSVVALTEIELHSDLPPPAALAEDISLLRCFRAGKPAA
ncbi:MAG: hypothetical protein JO366_14065 [Methylobacteriaceae bacterium]|nr:hypothetical protein [Methylobacteriaceae bacterium]MBV9245930.1 hypothetical protein [Methylobacteriaceae bacterium]